jgi:subtilisin family serine protease
MVTDRDRKVWGFVMNRFWTVLALIAPAAMAAQTMPAADAPKLSPALLERLAASGGGQGDVDIRIRLLHGADAENFRSALDAAGATDVRAWPEIRRVNARVPAGEIEALGNLEAVGWIDLIPPVDIDRDEVDGLRKAIGLETAILLPLNLQGRGVKVGVWEAGHPDIESLPGEFRGHDDFSGRVEVIEESSATPHATAVTGTLAGDGRRSAATGGKAYQWRGVAPGASVLYWTTMESDEEAAEVLDGIVSRGIQVALHPWGESVTKTRCSLFGDYTIRAAEFDGVIAGDDPAMAGEGRIPVVFSAGNYQNLLECAGAGGDLSIYPGFRTINPPHTAKNIIVVGAVNSEGLGMTDFSSWGPTDDGRIKPDVVAPGSQADGDGGITTTAYKPTDGYNAEEGTSYSAAGVAGALAVLIGERAERGAAALPPAAWKAILIQSAVDLTSDPLAEEGEEHTAPFRYPGPDYFHGYGLVWLPGAYRLSLTVFSPLGPAVPPPPFPPEGMEGTGPARLIEGTVGTGQERRYRLVRPADDPSVRVTLVWDDPPGEPSLPGALVNDLNLRVEEHFIAGLVIIHLPWVLDPLRPDLPAEKGIDNQNNVEQVEIDASASLVLRVVVKGKAVSRGPQRFWIAVGEGSSIEPDPSTLSFIIGDSNSTGQVDISDALAIFGYLFTGLDIACVAAGDATGDGRLDIGDGIRILGILFLGDSPSLPPILGQCETADPVLSCARERACW